MRDKLSRIAAALTTLPDTPERIALAFGLGVFLGFSPFLGLQTLLGIAFAYSVGLSRVAVILGTWVNLPWIVPVYYALATELGSRLLGVEPPSRLGHELRATVAHAGFGFAALGQLLDAAPPVAVAVRRRHDPWRHVARGHRASRRPRAAAFQSLLAMLERQPPNERGQRSRTRREPSDMAAGFACRWRLISCC